MPMLTVPLFVTPEDVIERMQLNPDLDGMRDIVLSALVGAQIKIESLLGYTLEIKAQDCIFQLDSESFSSMQPGGVYRLELPGGFIRNDIPFAMTVGDDWKLTNLETADVGDFKTDSTRGYVLVDATGEGDESYHDSYVRIQCTTGFYPCVPNSPATVWAYNGSYVEGDWVGDGINPTLYKCIQDNVGALLSDATCWSIPTASPWDDTVTYVIGDFVSDLGVLYLCLVSNLDSKPPSPISGGNFPSPNWATMAFGAEEIPSPIYEAIMSYVGSVLDIGQTTNRSDQAEKQYKKATDHANLILRQYLRLKGFSFRPLSQ